MTRDIPFIVVYKTCHCHRVKPAHAVFDYGILARHRTAKVPVLPQELFMIVRVITLLRGVLASMRVDVSSAVMWRPLALMTIADLTAVRCAGNRYSKYRM